MKYLRFFLQSLIIIIFILEISTLIAYSDDGEDDVQYLSCNQTFNCGLLQDIGYPFWGFTRPRSCGHQAFGLICEDAAYPTLRIDEVDFHLLSISRLVLATITIAPKGIWGQDVCLATGNVINTSFSRGLFDYARSASPLTLFYECPSITDIPERNRFNCSSEVVVYVDEQLLLAHRASLRGCTTNISTHVNQAAKEELWNGSLNLTTALNKGFDAAYNPAIANSCSACQSSGGVCGMNETTVKFSCLCRDHPYPQTCPPPPDMGGFGWRKLVIGLSCGSIVGGLAIAAIVFIYGHCKRASKRVDSIIRNYRTLAPKRYYFSDVKKMTNSFKEKLGQGGFGDVYKGNLFDGPTVAVKVLKESKRNGEEFINEVASISRTSHVNIVTLLGFCLEGSKRALIYEFMPNGSLEKFIFKECTTLEEESKQILGWEKLYHIALGIGRGLEYLHRGCNTRILHLDIKPQNILLDEEFCPKISDFGLSQLCSTKDSTVSMLEARGTIGYIAPEVFNRNFGVVSHKSDVYSFGMMVLEMVGGKKSNTIRTSTSSEYFPNWIYKDLEVADELELQGLRSKIETDIRKKMILVGLWCIQTKSSDRPSINRVIEMLEGSVEALPIPPKPFLSSPLRCLSNSATATSFDPLSLAD